MKAAVLKELDHLVVEEYPTPVCDDDSVLVKVKACAVCGSDIRIYHHGNSRVKPPQIIGHEISGEIIETGKNVTKFKVGDRIAVGADVPCGECPTCEAGYGNNCSINYAMGYQFAGGFAEYLLLNKTVVNYGPVHKIPDHVPYDHAALAEPLACVINALERCNIELCNTLVIIGCGPIGCMMIPVAKKMGVTKVICIGRGPKRLNKAMEIGADVLINATEEDPVLAVLRETGQKGADIVITANPNPVTHQQALHMAANRGYVNLFGGLAKGQSEVSLDSNLIHYKELNVIGSHGSLPRHHQKAVDLIASQAIDIEKFISHRFSLDEIKEAFEVSESRTGMRAIVRP